MIIRELVGLENTLENTCGKAIRRSVTLVKCNQKHNLNWEIPDINVCAYFSKCTIHTGNRLSEFQPGRRSAWHKRHNVP